MIENKYKVVHPEFIREAERLGLTGYQYHQKLIGKGILVDITEIEHRHRDNLAKKYGYKDSNDRKKDM